MTLISSLLHFIRHYWQGKFSLRFSFWIVLVLSGFMPHLLSSALLQQLSLTHDGQVIALVVYQVVTGLLLLPWQIIGVLRSAEFYFQQHGRPIILHSVQATVLVGLIVILSHFLGQFQTFTVEKNIDEFQARVKPVQYSIEWRPANNQVLLTGLFEIGITQAVRDLLQTQPTAQSIVLSSVGGQVYEGRGLAVLFDQYRLDTYSYGDCLSACTTAFIGGAKRYLGSNARLGFHQYAFDSKHLQTFQAFYNVEDEQDKDKAIYRSKNVNEDFIGLIFNKPNTEIWYPDQQTLLNAGVVTAIVPMPSLSQHE